MLWWSWATRYEFRVLSVDRNGRSSRCYRWFRNAPVAPTCEAGAMEGFLNRIPVKAVVVGVVAAYAVGAAASIGSLVVVAGARPLHAGRLARPVVTMPERLQSRTGT